MRSESAPRQQEQHSSAHDHRSKPAIAPELEHLRHTRVRVGPCRASRGRSRSTASLSLMNDDRCWHGLCATSVAFKPVSDAADAREAVKPTAEPSS
jgi:hypothetical protein